MQEQDDLEELEDTEDSVETAKDRHPLITIGILTAGTQMGSALIQRMGKHPLLLFGMGVAAGVYTYKNRKEIIQEAEHLKDQSKDFFSRKPDAE